VVTRRAPICSFLVVAVAVMVTGCSSSGKPSSAPSSAVASSGTSTSASAGWDNVVTQAKADGKVTLYTDLTATLLATLVSKFQAAYGIKIDAYRDTDAAIASKLQADQTTNKPTADVFVGNDELFAESQGQKGLVVKPTGPAIVASSDYDKAKYVNQYGTFQVNATLLGAAWNSSCFPKGIKTYADLLDPSLKGKIGILDPAHSPAAVDFYENLDTRGTDYLQKLAAQKPQIYPNTAPIGPALASGQVCATPDISPPTVAALKAQGAPISFALIRPLWGSQVYASVVANAPHPAAAQVLANYLITKDGQGVLAAGQASAVKNVSEAVADLSDVQGVNWSAQTPENVAAFRARFDQLFR
jgi:iron(III) transport system substrate-binding protein